MKDQQTLSRREAATFCGVHYNTIRQWEKAGRISPQRVMVGGVEEVRIPVEQLVDLVDSRGSSRHDSVLFLDRDTVAKNPESLALWRKMEMLQEENAQLRAELAAASSLVEELRARNTQLEADHRGLVKEVLAIAAK